MTLSEWIVRVIVTPAVYPRLVEFLHFDLQFRLAAVTDAGTRRGLHSEHWAEITLRQHHFLAIAMLCFN